MTTVGVDLRSCVELARRAAREGAAAIRAAGRAIERELPRDRKILADRAAEDAILSALEATPYAVLSEERGTTGEGEWRWIVDPLDGSVNYSQSIPMCAVSIALWKGHEPMLGVVFDFQRNELFSGVIGVGATLNGAPIAVAKQRARPDAILCTGFPVAGDFSGTALSTAISRVRDFKKVRLFGSAAVSLAYVAAGRADVYAEEGVRLWDVAAGLALVRAAGGVIRYKSSQADTYTVAAGSWTGVLPETLS